MIEEYIKHINEIYATNDLNEQKTKTLNFLNYLIKHGEEDVDTSILKQFCQKAMDILPGRSEPYLLIKKYNLSVYRRKSVSFNANKPEIFISNKKIYSSEGKRQALREDKKLSLINTDPSKRFKPSNNIEKLVENITLNVSMFEGIENKYSGYISNECKVLGSLGFTCDELILNPDLLKSLH